MLLDTHSVKTILIQMTNIHAETPAPPSAAYLKLLGKGVAKIEQLLKVVLRPFEPVEGLVETYMLLFNDPSVSNFQKVVELKGLKRAEEKILIDAFQRRLPTSNLTGAYVSSTSPLGPAPPGQAGGAAKPDASAAGGKFKTDFRKFVAGMSKKS
ncbi:hypothetical protein BDK51DRAFT_30825 [Blyttiomyces helicus]|uniref:Vps53 C-terminal domain-containing protein n=1 Tax=Blyttiomyces helicus TaxID=388810 RepID=A0A4P9WIR8_9FUNG|nr:hypothetical protein BDK51DRAFT_30825 [Blyttiomyces helicus]|eukprot:RKO92694.1 hypothetical protein BDK51DRAFT_30825 [Blyttiomyces helicus]